MKIHIDQIKTNNDDDDDDDDNDDDDDDNDDDDFEEFPLVAAIHRSLGIDPPHVTSPALKLGQIYG